jgi:hypothetical protein
VSHAEAAVAALNAHLSALTIPREAFDVDDVPTTLPDAYVEVSVSRRFIDGSPRGDGSKTGTGWRLLTRAVARSTSDARRLHDLCAEALEFQTLTVDGHLTTPLEFETADPIEDDEGWFSGAWVWTYLLTDTTA